MKALLLCAGQALRWRPYSLRHSKMALPFLNVPIMGWPLKLLEDLKVTRLTINTHSHPEQVESAVKKLAPRIPSIRFSHEPSLLGGAGAVKNNQPALKGDDFIYLNGDSVFFCSDFFQEMRQKHKTSKALITFLATPCIPKNAKILWAEKDGRLSPSPPSSAETKKQKLFFPGFALINSRIFPLIQNGDQELFTDLAYRIADQCFVFVKEHLTFFEVGSLPSCLESTKQALKHLLDDPAQSMEQTQIKQTLNRFCPKHRAFKKNSAHVLLGPDIQGLKLVEFQNFAVIGGQCSFSSQTVIQEGVIAPGLKFNRRKLSRSLALS